MGRKWRLCLCVVVLGLVLATSGCSVSSLSNLLLGPPPAVPSAPPAPTAGGTPPGAASLVGLSLYHYFAPQDGKVAFTVVPAPAAGSYLDGMGQVGPIDDSPTDPTLQTLGIVCNNFDAHEVVYVSLYTARGALAGTVPVKGSGTVEVAGYKATSCLLSGSSTDRTNPSPAPWAYLGRMTNSADTTFTFTTPPPPS